MAGSIWKWLIDPTDITAVSTLVIAAFTIILAVVGTHQARLTRQAIDLERRGLSLSQRAFVYLDGFEIDIGQDVGSKNPLFVTRFRISPRWRNSGGTPTKNMTVQMQLAEIEGGPPPNFGYGYDIAPEPLFIGPQAISTPRFRNIGSGFAQKAIQNGAGSGESDLFVWGRAEYNDILPNTKRHFTEWCVRIVFSAPDGKTLRAAPVQWGSYNRSDEDS